MLQPIIFALVTIAAFGFAFKQYMRIRDKILLGKDQPVGGSPAARWRNVLLVAFGQKKMFKNPIPAVLHLFIYVAFLFTQIELIEILIDGLGGVHRFFAPILGGFYTFIISFIEVLSVGAFIATVIFLLRRNALKVPRFQKPEMKGWPKLDGNLILIGEIILLIGIFSMNGADTVLQSLDAHYPDTGKLAVSSWLGPALFGGLEHGTLVVIERFGWWLHILTVYAFLNYLPISKHLHILLAFPNTYFAKLDPKGKMENMPEIMNEVKSMMDPNAAFDDADAGEELPVFGSNDVMSLSWVNVLNAFTCTECGRCTAECPANQTGKKLSPRKIMMDVRDRAEEISKNIAANNTDCIREDARGEGVRLTKDNYDDGKSLFDYISREEIHACTTCNACVEACPVLINPLDIILKLRRYEILTESAGPADWLPLFNAIENSGSAWAIPDDRDKWAQEATAE
ncbi:MAG: (Fe-S)-binding protein [Bacteroidetes bacterium]|nr:MAG: (Fe-S)-binding protein [Bacteroidota bacterium]